MQQFSVDVYINYIYLIVLLGLYHIGHGLGILLLQFHPFDIITEAVIWANGLWPNGTRVTVKGSTYRNR